MVVCKFNCELASDTPVLVCVDAVVMVAEGEVDLELAVLVE